MSANVRNEYDCPREASSNSPRRIKHAHHASAYHKGFKPLNGAIPEEMEEGIGMEQGYDMIKADLSAGDQYNKVCPQSTESQFGVTNPCYATASEEREIHVNLYDTPKDPK